MESPLRQHQKLGQMQSLDQGWAQQPMTKLHRAPGAGRRWRQWQRRWMQRQAEAERLRGRGRNGKQKGRRKQWLRQEIVCVTDIKYYGEHFLSQ